MRDDPEAERIYGWSDPKPAAAPQDARAPRLAKRVGPGTFKLARVERGSL